jgi:hypothetical protein
MSLSVHDLHRPEMGREWKTLIRMHSMLHAHPSGSANLHKPFEDESRLQAALDAASKSV